MSILGSLLQNVKLKTNVSKNGAKTDPKQVNVSEKGVLREQKWKHNVSKNGAKTKI